MAESFTSNATELAGKLDGMAARIGNPGPALEQLRAVVAQGEAEVFSTRGAAIGEHWTGAAEPGRKLDAQLLVASGTLRNSLTGAENGEVVGEELRLGTDVPYGRFHEFGTSRMPARPFLGVPAATRAQVSERMAVMFEEALR